MSTGEPYSDFDSNSNVHLNLIHYHSLSPLWRMRIVLFSAVIALEWLPVLWNMKLKRIGRWSSSSFSSFFICLTFYFVRFKLFFSQNFLNSLFYKPLAESAYDVNERTDVRRRKYQDYEKLWSTQNLLHLWKNERIS